MLTMTHDDEFPVESNPVVLSDDRERVVDDLGRRAGAALRYPVSANGAAAIVRRARRQRMLQVGGVAVGVIALVAVGIAVVGGSESKHQQPVTNVADDTVLGTEVSSPAPSTTNSTQQQSSTTVAAALPAANPLVVTAGTSVDNRSIEKYVEELAYSSDGSVLAGVGVGFALRIYDTATLAMKRELACPTVSAAGSSTGFAWDRQVAATWDAESRALKTAMSSRQGFGGDCEIAFSADGSLAARTASAETTILWNAVDGTEIAVLQGVSPVFSPDGAMVITFGSKGTKVWTSASGASLATLAGDSDWAVFSPDGTRFVTLGQTIAQLWDTHTLQPLTSLKSNATPVNAAFSSDGTRLATANGQSASIWDTTTGDELHRLEGGGGNLIHIAFSPDNTLLATGGIQDERLRVFDAGTGQQLADLYQDTPVSGFVAFSPDNKTLAVSVTPDGFSTSQRGLHLWTYSRN